MVRKRTTKRTVGRRIIPGKRIIPDHFPFRTVDVYKSKWKAEQHAKALRARGYHAQVSQYSGSKLWSVDRSVYTTSGSS